MADVVDLVTFHTSMADIGGFAQVKSEFIPEGVHKVFCGRCYLKVAEELFKSVKSFRKRMKPLLNKEEDYVRNKNDRNLGDQIPNPVRDHAVFKPGRIGLCGGKRWGIGLSPSGNVSVNRGTH
jgi:hypothetical protein